MRAAMRRRCGVDGLSGLLGVPLARLSAACRPELLPVRTGEPPEGLDVFSCLAAAAVRAGDGDVTRRRGVGMPDAPAAPAAATNDESLAPRSQRERRQTATKEPQSSQSEGQLRLSRLIRG